MFEIMAESQDKFQIIAEGKFNVEADADVEEVDLVSDDDILLEMRRVIESILLGYARELADISFDEDIAARRVTTLRRVLLKMAESVVEEVVLECISVHKESILDDIDTMFCLGLATGRFEDGRIKVLEPCFTYIHGVESLYTCYKLSANSSLYQNSKRLQRDLEPNDRIQ